MIKHKLYKKSKSGFTMVELSLTLGFIGALLISIAVITTNIVSIYQKGLTIKAVNSVGRGLIDEFTSAINLAPSVDTTSLCNNLVTVRDGNRTDLERCITSHAFKYIFQANVDPNTGEQYNGVFCTGYYSYIWNTYYSETADMSHNLKLKYRDAAKVAAGETGEAANVIVGQDEPFRLLRVEDHNYRVCSAITDSNYNTKADFSSDSLIDITKIANSTLDNPIPAPTGGFLNEFDLDLTLRELTIFPISQDSVTLRSFMSGTFILATLRGNIDIKRTGDYCSLGVQLEGDENNPVGDTSSLNSLGSEFNYCAINKFNFAARTAGV